MKKILTNWMDRIMNKEANKEEILIGRIIRVFRDTFAESSGISRINSNTEITELTDDTIREIVNNYLSKPKLTEANQYWYDIIKEYINGSHDDVNWKLGRELAEETPEYKQWVRSYEASSAWCHAKSFCKLEDAWVEKNGKVRTDEEAAKVAASKWCELIFDWHLQDNGALEETHPGGFTACMLGTVLANDSKQGITEDVKQKAYDLLVQYYMHYLHYVNNGYDYSDINWANETMPDPEPDNKDRFDWKYGFSEFSMSCDYGPSSSLWCLLVNAGVDSRDARNICPWKTHIRIRKEDNAVFYGSYQKSEEL